jgi:hypothetical protein
VKLRSGAFAFLVVVACVGLGCAKKPTMKLHHAEVTGVQFGFPPSLGVQMTVVMDVFNPNSYDVAIRAVRGTVTFADRYTLPVNFQPGGEGVWLTSDATTQVRVPCAVPIDLAMQLLRETYMMAFVPFRVVGKADVTATRSFKVESDDYSVDERGQLSRQVIEMSLAHLGIPIPR